MGRRRLGFTGPVPPIPTGPPFDQPPPDRDRDVLRQRFGFDSDRWRVGLPDPGLWPPALDDCPQGRRWPLVDRAAVFTAARAAAESGDGGDALRALVTIFVWGCGTRAREVTRRLRVFADTPADQVADRLLHALQVQDVDGPIEAYRALASGDRVRGLGPAYYTKWLYFAGYGRVVGPRQPLIFDSRVAASLTRLTGDRWDPTQTAHYERYLDVTHAWADQWGAADADVVEVALFAFDHSD